MAPSTEESLINGRVSHSTDGEHSPIEDYSFSVDTHLDVLHVCETAKGGIATYLSVVDQSTSSSIFHRIILPRHHRDDLPEQLQVCTYEGPQRGIFRLWRMWRTLRSCVRRDAPDVIFCHSTFTLPIILMLRIVRSRVPILYCAHGWSALRYPQNSLKRRIVARVEGLLAGLADSTINISRYEMKHAADSCYSGTHRLVENAVLESKPTSELLECDPGQINLLFVGRFDRQKGLDLLLNALGRIWDARPEICLHVVGGSVLGDGLSQLDSKNANIRLYGWRDSQTLSAFYRQADLVVVPSRWEGFGLVVAESYRAGTPVLVSDRCALPGLVDEGSTGFVCRLNIDSLCDGLMRLDKTDLGRMRPACEAMYRSRFHASRFGREIEEILHEVASK